MKNEWQKKSQLKGDVSLDSVHLIWEDVMVWVSTLCLFIFMNLFFKHIISSSQLQIFYSVFAVLIRSPRPKNLGEGSCCSCNHTKVKSTPRFGLCWEFDKKVCIVLQFFKY